MQKIYLFIIVMLLVLCTISFCLCKIMKSRRPLKSLAISIASFVPIIFICYVVTLYLLSLPADGNFAWLGILFLMTAIIATLLILIPPSILITHAIVINGGLSGTTKFTYKKQIVLFFISVIVDTVAFIVFKLIRWIF